jgi:hypothetical protein
LRIINNDISVSSDVCHTVQTIGGYINGTGFKSLLTAMGSNLVNDFGFFNVRNLSSSVRSTSGMNKGMSDSVCMGGALTVTENAWLNDSH